jgi:hypothetical protein
MVVDQFAIPLLAFLHIAECQNERVLIVIAPAFQEIGNDGDQKNGNEKPGAQIRKLNRPDIRKRYSEKTSAKKKAAVSSTPALWPKNQKRQQGKR